MKILSYVSFLFGFHHVKILYLTLNNKHALVVFEIKAVINFERRHFAELFHRLTFAHFLNEGLLCLFFVFIAVKFTSHLLNFARHLTYVLRLIIIDLSL